jgi:hypothetical protein
MRLATLVREMSVANPLWGAPRPPWGFFDLPRRLRFWLQPLACGNIQARDFLSGAYTYTRTIADIAANNPPEWASGHRMLL